MSNDKEYDELVAALDRRWADLSYSDIAVLRRGIAAAKAMRAKHEWDEEWALRIGEGPAVFRTLDGLEAFVRHEAYVRDGRPMRFIQRQVEEKRAAEPVAISDASKFTVRKIRSYAFEGWRHTSKWNAIAIFQEVAP